MINYGGGLIFPVDMRPEKPKPADEYTKYLTMLAANQARLASLTAWEYQLPKKKQKWSWIDFLGL